MVHIEELWQAFQTYSIEAQKSWTDDRTGNDLETAQNKLKAFCDSHNLPIDWTKRND